jgi:HSP20 family protein
MSLMKRDEGFLPAFSGWFNDPFFRDFFGGGLQNYSPIRTTLPSANVKETKDDYKIELAVPGMSKEDFKVSMDGDMLSISSEKTEESGDQSEENYNRREFSYQSFYRTFRLPKASESDKIQAKYKDGILHVTIPKKEEAKQKEPRLIEIS